MKNIIEIIILIWNSLIDFYNYCNIHNIAIITFLIVFFSTQIFKKKIYEQLKFKIFIKHKSGFLTLFAFIIGVIGIILELLYNKVQLNFINLIPNILIVVGLSSLISSIWKTLEKIDIKAVVNALSYKFLNIKIFNEDEDDD